MMMSVLLWLAAYLVASIPFGVVVARLRGVDIRKHGSGNIGATNVGRVLGKRWGLLVLLLDALKGAGPMVAAAVATARWPGLLPGWGEATRDLVRMGTGVAAVLGSVLPLFAGLRGGKAVGTSMGVVLAVPELWPAAAAALLTWGIVRYASGYVSLASLAAATVLPTTYYVTRRIVGLAIGAHYPFLLMTLALAALVYVRHRANIGRLLAGTEPRAGASGAGGSNADTATADRPANGS